MKKQIEDIRVGKMAQLKKIVEKQLNIEDITVRNREQHYTFGRWVFWAACRKLMPHTSYTNMAAYMKRDHATAMHGVKNIEYLKGTDKEYYYYLYRSICADCKEAFNDPVTEYKTNVELREEIQQLKKSFDEKIPFANEIMQLPYNKYMELNFRIETFLKVNNVFTVQK